MISDAQPTPPAKVQFNVYLSPELVREVKHRSIDEGVSLSALVERVLVRYISSPGGDLGSGISVTEER